MCGQGGDRLLALADDPTTPGLLQAHAAHLCCLFGDTVVPCRLLRHGVLQCTIPPHGAGRVVVSLAFAGDGPSQPRSNAVPFTFVKREVSNEGSSSSVLAPAAGQSEFYVRCAPRPVPRSVCQVLIADFVGCGVWHTAASCGRSVY